jgi:DNA-binding response OmpR family regulator
MIRKKILIVDDNEDLLVGLGVQLSAAGYDIFIAEDAAKAVQIVKEEKPQLIILDIGLPGVSGFVVMERLKRIAPAPIPIIVLSARVPSEVKEKAYKAGAKAYFHKPADNTKLLETIDNILDDLSETW